MIQYNYMIFIIGESVVKLYNKMYNVEMFNLQIFNISTFLQFLPNNSEQIYFSSQKIETAHLCSEPDCTKLSE